MRIAIVGSQCTGKTTLLNKIKEDQTFSSQYVFIDEIVRSLVREKGIKINKEGDYTSQLMIFQAHYLNAIQYPDMITDRSCIDAWAYTLHNKFEQDCFKDNEMDTFQNIFSDTLKYYDLIFYLPVEFALVSDNFRSMDTYFRLLIDETFRDIFMKCRLKVVTLMGLPDERFDLFKKVLCEKVKI